MMRLVEIVAALLAFLFLFGGCAATAIAITPTTLIVTLILGALFILRPTLRLVWRIFAGLHLLAYTYSAGMFTVLWLWAIYTGRPGAEDGPETIPLLIIRALMTPVLVGAALVLSAFNIERASLRFLCVVLQALAVVIAWHYITSLLALIAN